MADPVTAPAPAPAPAPTDGNNIIEQQKALNAEAMRLNLAMAWQQMFLSLIGKLAGR